MISKNKCKCILISTEDLKNSAIYIFKNKYKPFDFSSQNIPYHLYIISDENIKINDWVICCGADIDAIENNNIFHNAKILQYTGKELGVSKIILSTNPELNLHIPSNSFIEYYCEKCGIDEVLIEFEMIPISLITPYTEKFSRVRIAPDNTIPIFVKKDNLDTEQLIREWANYSCTGRGQFWKPKDLDIWIDENLYLKFS